MQHTTGLTATPIRVSIHGTQVDVEIFDFVSDGFTSDTLDAAFDMRCLWC